VWRNGDLAHLQKFQLDASRVSASFSANNRLEDAVVGRKAGCGSFPIRSLPAQTPHFFLESQWLELLRLPRGGAAER